MAVVDCACRGMKWKAQGLSSFRCIYGSGIQNHTENCTPLPALPCIVLLWWRCLPSTPVLCPARCKDLHAWRLKAHIFSPCPPLNLQVDQGNNVNPSPACARRTYHAYRCVAFNCGVVGSNVLHRPFNDDCDGGMGWSHRFFQVAFAEANALTSTEFTLQF